MLAGDFSQPGQVAGLGSDRAGIADDRLQDHARNLTRMRGECLFHRREIVVRQRQRMHGGFGRNARRARYTERRHTAAGFYEQRIGMAVVTAFKLDHKRPAGKSARQPYSRHTGLRARGNKAQFFDGGEALLHQLGEIAFSGRAGAKRSTASRGFPDRCHGGREGVTQQHGPP